MENEGEQNTSSPTLAEVLVVSQFILLGIEIPDLLNWLIVFKIISIGANAAFLIYTYIRKLPPTAVLVTSAINLIPIADWLPLTIVGYWVAVWLVQQQQKGGLAGAVATATIAATSAASGKGAASTGGAAANQSAGAMAANKAASATTTGTVAGGVTTATASGTTTSTAGTAASGYSHASLANNAPTGASATGGAPASGAAQYAKEVQQEQDPLLQLNKQLTQQTPGTIDRPTGGHDDVAVDDDTNTIQLPYAA